MGVVVPRGWRDRAFRPQEASASGNSDSEVLAAHDAETINPHIAQEKTLKASQPGAIRPARHISGRTPYSRAPAGGGRVFRGERHPRMRKGQSTESVRTRSCRVVTSEADGRFTYHTSPGVPVRRAATSGDREALGVDVSRLWCSECQHATCAFVSPGRRAGKPTPVVGPRDLPRPEADVHPPPSGKRCAL